MKKLLLIILFLTTQVAIAQEGQYQLVVTSVSYSGNCGGMKNVNDVHGLEGALQKAISIGMSQSLNGQIYPSEDICKSALHSMSGSYGGCTTKVSGYCRPLGGGRTSVGHANVLGVGQGSSFYSINGANEIKNWSEDDMERMLALNPEYSAASPYELSMGSIEADLARNNARENAFVLDTSKPFVSINMREGGSSLVESEDLSMRDGFSKVEMANDFSHLANRENVEKYVNYCCNLSDLFIDLDNPFYGDITMLLHQKFKEVSGFDLEAIMLKLPSERTEAEKQALIDYQEFRKRVTDNIIKDIETYVANLPETKDFEMAALAEDCYKDSEHAFLSRTNYKKVQTDFFEDGSQMRGLSELINDCNATNLKTGFHADLYYNEKTKEYTIAFEGTNVDEKADLEADAILGLGGIPEQYKLAYKIGEYINNPYFPSNVKINVTGHSLGGGLASLVGLVTNKPTFTYNAAGINKNMTDVWGLTEKVERKDYNNIKVFQSEKDQLTSVQEGELKPVAVSLVVGIVSVVSPPTGRKVLADAATGRAAAPAVGNREKVWNNEGHSIVPMVSYLVYSNSKYESIKNEIYEKGHGVEYQTQETIQIFTGL